MSNIISLSTITQGGYVAVMKDSNPIIIPVNSTIMADNSPASILRKQEKKEIFGRIWSPEEQYALFLRNLKRAAENYLGESVTEAVISVPGHFSYHQRQAVRNAAKIAGMTTKRLISEATSIALEYYNKYLDTKLIISIVITEDFIDLSALACEAGVLEVLSEHTCKTSKNLGNDIRSLIQEAILNQQSIFNENNYEIDNISEILISGTYGDYIETSTYLQAYYFNSDFVYMPNECIALGAAYMCGKLSGNTACPDFLLLDVVHTTISFTMTGGIEAKLLEKNKTIPSKKSQTFTSPVDDYSDVDIYFYAGEDSPVINNTNIGHLLLPDIIPLKSEIPYIEITIEIDADGIIICSAKNLISGFETKVVCPLSCLSEEDIENSRLFIETWSDEQKYDEQKSAQFDHNDENQNDNITFENSDYFRKKRERTDYSEFEEGAKSILMQLLPVIDNIEQALETSSKDPQAALYTQELSMIYHQLKKNLKEAGVFQIQSIGKTFDPNYHSAIAHVEDPSFGENIIVEEFQKGYIYNDRVIRYSIVKVAK